MKPVTLKQPAVGHVKSYEACPPKNGNLGGGEVYDSKAASNQSRLGLVGLHDKLGVLHLEYRATRYRDFETSVVGEVFAQWNLLIIGGDRTINPRTDNEGRTRGAVQTADTFIYHLSQDSQGLRHTNVHNPVKKALVARGCRKQGQHHQHLRKGLSPKPIGNLSTPTLVPLKTPERLLRQRYQRSAP